MVIPLKAAPLTTRGSISRRRDPMGARSPWKTLELVFLIIYAAGFYFLIIRRSLEIAADFSTGSKSGKLRGLRLDKYWNRLNDTSDSQWRNFRDNIPILTVVMAVFLLTGNAIRKYFSLGGRGMSRVLLVFSLAYILYLHGACFVFLLVIITGNYIAVKMLAGRPMFPAFIWLYNLFFLVNNRVFEGYSFSLFGNNYAYLDNFRGVQRWHICFNFVMLRMVSFGLDYHWALISRQSTVNLEKHLASCSLCSSGSTCYLIRQETSLSLSSYCPEIYVSYLFYPPLYIAGPIISFNAFASQMECPQKNYKKRDICLYGLRWISCLALMEALTHYFYYNSLSISGIWQALSPWEIFAVGYGVLNFMWLKFLLIWRFFRFWALVGGIEVVENMPSCINNCYDLEGFWKSWHASYNRWLVRYLYVPLGGSRWRLLNIWVVFTFVAVWHDLEWRLLSWAWVTCLIMVPELSVKSLMRTNTMKPLRESAIYRELCAIGGAVTIAGLMTANLIGFVVGPDKMHWLLQAMVEPENILTTVGILCSFYIGTKLMFHVRELRAHHNVTNKQAD